jgi:hypothetical protein
MELEFLSSHSSSLKAMESLDFHSFNSWINRSYGGETPRDDTNPSFQFEHGFLYYKGLLYIFEDPYRFQVLQFQHDNLSTRYFGFNKTMELISRDF